MTAEKTLLLTNAALLHLRDNAAENVRNILEALKADAESEIRKASARKRGSLDRFKACGRIIKSAKADAYREALHGAWIADGSQYVCDGFRLVKLSDPLDLEEIPANVLPLDGSRLLADARKNDGATLDLPDPATLRAYIKTEKARLKASGDKSAPVWDFGTGAPAVNAQFLLDLLEIFPDATATASSYRIETGNIYFASADGEALLCPIRKAAKR